MKILSDIEEFNRRTRPLMDVDFALIDIVPTTRLGFFSKGRLPELILFCQNNPEYHIMSTLKNTLIKVNTVIDMAAFYMLGQGERDPELMFLLYMDEKSLSRLKTLEF